MTSNRYEVADGLFELSRQLADFDACGVVLDGDAVRAMRRQLKDLAAIAHRQAQDLSRMEWNDRARREREQAKAVLAEASRPGSNLRLLAPPQPFSDGGLS